MDSPINHISINDIFWLQIKSHLVSFGFKGLPDDVHYTISFSDLSTKVNLHVTKNVSDHTNKPQVKIIEIEKDLLEKIAPELMKKVLRMQLQPLDIDELKNNYEDAIGFIPYDELSRPEYQSVTEKRLIEMFSDIARIRKKTKLKISGDIDQRFEAWTNSEDTQREIIDAIIELPIEISKKVMGGVILTPDQTIQAISLNGKWYSLKTDLKPAKILEVCIGPVLAKQIVWKAKRALVIVKYANSYSDTEPMNKPVHLVLQKKE